MEKIKIVHDFHCDKCDEFIFSVVEEGHTPSEISAAKKLFTSEEYLNQRTYHALLCAHCRLKFKQAIGRTESDEDKMRILMEYKFQKDFNE